MSDLLATLRELHRIHQQLADLRDRMERGPRQIKAREANLARLEADVERVREEQKQARMAVDQKNLQLRTGESKIADLKGRLNQASSNREYQTFKEQIAADEMANSVLEDEILESMEKVDEYKQIVAETEATFKQGQEEFTQAKKQVSEQHEKLETEIARLQDQLVTTEAKLPEDVQDTYQRIIRGKGSEGLAAVESNSCSGCYQQITPQNYNALSMGHAVFCGSCGRLLYLLEEKRYGSGGEFD